MVTVLLLKVFFIFSLTHLYFLSVNCAIASLSVKKVDQKLIERKRQDTLELCKLFNEENGLQFTTHINPHANNGTTTQRRIKRNVNFNKDDNPVLKQEDLLRVEKIVDKLYDDSDENGNRVLYRKRKANNITKKMMSKPSRRYNFAPAQLFGPLEKDASTEKVQDEKLESKISWIKKWNHGILPYFIDPNTYDSVLSATILKAFDYIEKVTCIRLQRLREKPIDKRSLESVEWLYITNPSGIRQCVHSNERKPNTGVQMVVFGYDCLSRGEIAHEVMHALGFSHEHTRADRDRYITILWDNIKPGYKKYFETRSDDQLLNLPYDYASVLHYPPRAFSKNGQITVMVQSDVKVGQREVLSDLDVEKIGLIYGHECVERNKDYLLKTCPSVVNVKPKAEEVTAETIVEYFKDRIWPYGIVNYQIKNKMEFTPEERENMKAVFDHIEKETCIEFRDVTQQDDNDKSDNSTVSTTLLTDGEKTTEALVNKENVESNTIAYDKENSKQLQDNEINVEKEITSNVHTTSTSLKMKMTLLKKASSPSNKKTFEENNKLNKSKRRHATHKYIKNSKSLKAKQSTKNKATVYPMTPARRHAANVLLLARSSNPGCQCPVAGRPNGNQELMINGDCFNSVNDLLHLFSHVLGLEHQHKMHDRDSFLHIEWDKLTPEITDDIKEKLPPAASAGFSYDYQSVMHYPWLRIKDGVSNIMYPVWNDGWAMGHWQGLSWVDVQKINYIYLDQCEKRKKHTLNT